MAVHSDKATVNTDKQPLVLRLPGGLDDDKLLAFSSLNPDLRFERNARGELIVMLPAGGGSSRRNAQIIIQLGTWSNRDGTGEVFDSSGGFVLPNGALRSPDASWVSKPRLEKLTALQREKFLPLCPEFVVELRSPSDNLSLVKEKLQEYINNGAKLGWLLDPEERRVYIYTPEGVTEVEDPDTLSGEPVLRGFALALRDVW